MIWTGVLRHDTYIMTDLQRLLATAAEAPTRRSVLCRDLDQRVERAKDQVGLLWHRSTL